MARSVSPMEATHLTAIVANAHASKRDRDRDLGVSIYLTERQAGRCFDCGEACDSLEFAHFTRAAGRAVAVGGDLLAMGAMACRRCNLIHDAVTRALDTDGTLPTAYFTARGRGDRVNLMLPTRAELVRMARESREGTEDAFRTDVASILAEIA